MKRKATSSDLFSQREQEIIKRLSTGLSNQQIADELCLSPETVKWYNRQIYGKLGIKSRAQVIIRANDLGLIERSHEPSSPSPVSRPNLPTLTPLFLGRSREITEVKQLLHTSRLLTLTGTGGIGKTQLALRVAAEIASAYPDGVCFVDLAPLSDHHLVAKAIAAALGVVEHPTQSLPETLTHALAEQQLLLLLDNFEHVIQAAPLLVGLLACTHLRVLVTSREPLRIKGEQEYQVPPFSLPPAETTSIKSLTASEAGLFFVRCTQLILPHFQPSEVTAPVIGRICTRLDGLPLAIELAAARCKLFSPQALLERLKETGEHSPLRLLAGRSQDAPPRQRTLRDSIAWSYALLDEDEQRLLTRLAVFRGGRSLEAIENVCAEDLSIDVLDGLASLVDKHLVQQKDLPGGEPRFVLLEMIQEYAHEQLQASGEEGNMRRRHARYFVELAERAEPEWRQAGFKQWSARLGQEMENLRAVLSWSLSGGDVAMGIRLAGALCLFWYGNGHHVEGRRWAQQLFTRLDEVPLVYHPKFLLSAGHLAFLYNLEEGKPLFRRALDAARTLGDQLQIAWALALLGYTMLRDPAAAMPLAEESLAMFRELAHLPGIAQALNIIGEIARSSGNDDHARQVYEECLAICQQTGETRRIAFMYDNLTFIALHQGEAERARDLARQGLQLVRELNNRLDQAKFLALPAGAFGASGQPELAARLLGASERALEQLGAFYPPSDTREIENITSSVRVQLDEPTFQAAWAQGRELTLEQAVALALDA